RAAAPMRPRQRARDVAYTDVHAPDWNLVVLVVEPAEYLLQHLYPFGRIGLERRPQGRALGQRHRLERSRLRAVQDAAGAVDVAAAQRHDARRRAAEHVHERVRLPSRAQDQIDDDVRADLAQLVTMLGEPRAIAKHFTGDLDLRFRVSAVKEDDVVAGAGESGCDLRPDDPAAADQKNAHRPSVTGPAKLGIKN